MAWTLLAALIAFPWLCGCNQKTVAVKGQVLIVTQDGQNVPLGDLQIFLVDRSEMLKAIQTVQDKFHNDRTNLENAVNFSQQTVENAAAYGKSREYRENERVFGECARQINSLTNQINELEEQNRKYRDAARATLDKPTAEFIYLDYRANKQFNRDWRDVKITEVELPEYESDEFIAWRSYMDAKKREAEELFGDLEEMAFARQIALSTMEDIATKSRPRVADAQAELDNNKQKLASLLASGASLLVENTPQKGKHAIGSDADGRFTCAYRQNEGLVLFATARRTGAPETERYCWLMNVPTESTDSYSLSNSNLLDNDPDSYLGAIKTDK